MEIEASLRATDRDCGNTPTHPPDECRQSVVGAPRIHGELLKLGIEVGQTSVAKYGAEEGSSVAGMEDVPS
jgi:hypothetical protein